jgi:RNA polymerase sigma-70 factor (ECF subfamily)
MGVVDEGAWQARQFELHRAHLQAVAYRMLGSVTEAEDAVQEAWFRLNRSDDSAIENMQAWLTTVIGRICIDMLRSRQARREDAVGSWLPEPLVSLKDLDDHDGPEDEAILADSVGLALMVVLETLTPAERLAFVLHDMFGVPFEEIATVLDRTPSAARKLASRARRRVQGASPAPDRDLSRQRAVASAFLAAARAGDFDALVAVLHPDVVFRVDTGSRVAAGTPVRTGAADVAREFVVQGPRFASLCRLAVVNGAVGIVARTRSGPLAVAGLTIAAGRIAEINLVLDPDKLRRLVPDDEEPRG